MLFLGLATTSNLARVATVSIGCSIGVLSSCPSLALKRLRSEVRWQSMFALISERRREPSVQKANNDPEGDDGRAFAESPGCRHPRVEVDRQNHQTE